MEILDTTIVNVALPHIAGSLSSTYDDATWTLTSYLVANGIVLTISGWLGKLFGRKRYFLICIAMFSLSSFLCGISASLPELILFRLMQGFFGGGLQPNQQSIILDTFPPSKRAAAFGLTAIATVVAPVLGPSLGGGSRITIRGGGCSSSTCRLASWPPSRSRSSWMTRHGRASRARRSTSSASVSSPSVSAALKWRLTVARTRTGSARASS